MQSNHRLNEVIRMIKKVLIAILAFLMVIPFVAGCSDPFNDDDLGKNEVEGKITIRVGVLSDSNEISLMSALKREFEKTNDLINIKIEQFSGNFNEAMTTYIKDKNNMPDVVMLAGDKHSPFTYSGENFLDLRPYYESSPETSYDKYYASMLDVTHSSNSDESIWYAPRDYNKPVLFLNTEIFDKAGVPVPKDNDWTYERFLDTCKALRAAMDSNENGLRDRMYPLDGNLGWNAVYLGYLESFGGSVFNTEAQGDAVVTIDSDATVNAYKKMYEDLVLTRYATDPNKTSNGFTMKNTAMWFSVRPRLPAVITSGIKIDFVASPFDHIGAGNTGYAISSVAKNRKSDVRGNTKNNADLAWEFIKFIITEPGQKVFGQTGAGVPVLKSLAKDTSWRATGGTNLNHDAFIVNEDKDININQVYDFPPSQHILLNNLMDEAVLQGCRGSNYVSTDGKIESYGTMLAEIKRVANEMRGIIRK